MVSMLKLNKSPGLDSISNEIIKQFHLAFPSFLHKLFNVCLGLGIFPRIWKLAQVILIPKVNEFRVPHLDNLRCICLLPALGKCLEKLFVNRISWYLRRGDFLSSDQYGFTPHKSTEDALLRLNEIVKRGKKKHLHSILISLDIKVCSQGRDLSETFLHAQEALNFASDWSKSFKLEFNPDKTRFMAIEKRNVCYDAFELYLDGTPLTMENLSASSISNYDCILSPFFIPHPSERNAINIVQFSGKSTEDFPVICYTDGSKIDGRVGFAFVVFRSGVESENFQFRIRDECTVFVAELLCLNFAVKWITEQNSVISEYLICTDSLSSLDSLKCISSSNNIIVEIQKQLKSLRDKNISIDFAFVRGHTGVLGNERADLLAKAATKRKTDIDVNIPKSFYKKITNERMMKSWNQEYLISNKGSITKKFFPTINKRLSCHHFYTNYKLTQFLTGHGYKIGVSDANCFAKGLGSNPGESSEIAEFLRQKLHLEILGVLHSNDDVELALYLGFLSCDVSILSPENIAALNEMVEEENKGVSNAATSAQTLIQDICQHIAGPSQESKSSEQGSDEVMDIEKPIQYLLNDDIEPSDPEDEDYDFDEDEESSSTESDEESNAISAEEFFKSEPGYLSGSTATVAVVSESRIYVANVGDSRCVLSRNGQAIDMSVDHKPDDPSERYRIVNAGGSVSDDGRVNNCLNLSRAFGDYKFKGDSFVPAQQCITAEPYVTSIDIQKEDDFLVIASDGIWNSMNSQDVIDYINIRLAASDCSLKDICEELFQFILAPDKDNDGSGCDNMCCIIIKFHNDNANFSKESSVSNKVTSLESSLIKREDNLKIEASHETCHVSADGTSTKNVSSSDKETISNQDQNNARLSTHNSKESIRYSLSIGKNELLSRLLRIYENIYSKLLDHVCNFRFSEYWKHRDGSGRPRTTADEEDRLIVRSAVTAPESSLSTIKCTTRHEYPP
ncbi:probable protein phosphatase CG10417 [Trichonephila clavipes]|nr:probable protein phosphatase CG10417 [Trichonephila clavipes]